MTYEVIDWRNLRCEGEEQHCNMVIAMCNGYKLYDADSNMMISAMVTPLPTMCGGRYISIQPCQRTLDVSFVSPVPSTFYGDGLNWFPCASNGLLAIVAELPFNMMQELREQMQSFQKFLHSKCGKYCAMDESRDYISPAPTERDYERYAWMISLADIDRHEGEGGDEDEGECEECGGTVYACDDGYCEECDWHTYMPENEMPEEDHGMNLTGSPDMDYGEHFTLEQLDYDYGFEDGYAYRWVGTFWDAGNTESRVRVMSTIVNVEAQSFETLDSKEGDGEKLDIERFIEEWVLPSCMWRGPVFISSNVAEATYHTPYLIAALRSSAHILRNYGMRLVAADHFATNPNERDHYIDGIMIVGCDRNAMLQSYRRALTRRP